MVVALLTLEKITILEMLELSRKKKNNHVTNACQDPVIQVIFQNISGQL